MRLSSVLQPVWAKRLAGSPFFAALTAVAAAVVGLLGSVYQSDIAKAFPLQWSRQQGWTVRSIVFWTALLSLGWLVYLRQLADDAVRDKLVKTTAAAGGNKQTD